MKKNVLITGSAGFVGYHVAKALAERGDHVVGLDNFNDYYSPSLKRHRADELKKLHIPIIEGDICHPDDLHRAMRQHKPTHIIHLAAQAGVRYSLVNPQAYLKANLEGFLNILEICRKNPHIPLIYASSSSVYGRNENSPFSIQDRTDKQASLYGVTKKTNELMAETYHHLYGVRTTGLRFFTVYGPWGRPDMAYYAFSEAILSGKPIDIFNHGKMQRDFTYIDDIVAGTIAALDLGADSALFNLGNNQPVEVLKFVTTLEKLLGKEAQKRFLPMQPGDVHSTFADITESTARLGFVPKTSLETGLARFVDWFLEYKDKSGSGS